MFDIEFIERLADAVAHRIAPAVSVPVEDQLWDLGAVAAHLHRSPQIVRDTMACLPSFPKAIRLPSKGRAQPLYNAGEVIDWAKRHQDKN